MLDINADCTMDCGMYKEWKDVRLFHRNENYQPIELRAEFKHSLKIKMKNIYFVEISLQQLKMVRSSLYYSQRFNWLDAIIWLKIIPLIFTCIGPVLHCSSRAQWFNIDLCLQTNHTLSEPYISHSFGKSEKYLGWWSKPDLWYDLSLCPWSLSILFTILKDS